MFWGPKVAYLRFRVLLSGSLIVPDREEKTIIMKRFLNWQGISKKKKTKNKSFKIRLLLFLHLTL